MAVLALFWKMFLNAMMCKTHTSYSVDSYLIGVPY